MVQNLAGKDAQLNPAQVQAMRAMLGTPDGSLFAQYSAYLGQLAPRQLRPLLHLLPVLGHRGHRAGPSGGRSSWSIVTRCCRSSSASLLGAYAAWRRNTRFDTRRDARLDVPRDAAAVLDRPAAAVRLRLHARAGSRRRWLRGTTPGLNRAFIQRRRSHSFLPALTLLIVTPDRLGPRHAQHDDHESRRGLHPAGQGQGAAGPDRRPAVCRAQRAAAQRHRLRPRPRRCARRRDPRRDGLRLPGPRPAHGRGGRRTRTTRCCRRSCCCSPPAC